MHVLITGGAGYVGGAVLEALRAGGHTPLALAHSDESESVVRARGGVPVRGDLRDPRGLGALAARADAVIHAANTNAPDAADVDAAATRALLHALDGTGRPFIYTSGVWVLGDTGDAAADETSTPRPTPHVAWRAGVETAVAGARGVRGVVLRPGVVFGEGGGIPGMLARGALPVVGSGAQRWPLVHVRDLADLYVRALGAPAGAVLHAVSIASTMRDLAPDDDAAASLPLAAARERLGTFADALALDQVVSAERTRALLGWSPARTAVDVVRRASLAALSIVLALTTVLAGDALAQRATGGERAERVGRSPWGPADEIGTLNMMTDSSRAAILARVRGGKAYDLAVEYFNGMPSWYLAGDPLYQLWMTHTPRGHAVDDPLGVGAAQNAKVAYTGDAVSMYTHTGTHIDALNHFGLHGEVWNGFAADRHLGDRGWTKVGVEKFPPIVARGVLIDVAAYKGVTMLPDSYSITPDDLRGALARQGTRLQPGDVVLIRGGRMTVWPNVEKYVLNQPGLGLPGAKWLVDEMKAMVVGGDNLSLEHFPVHGRDNWIPVHSFLLAQRGVPIIEVAFLEEVARDRVYEFAFVAGPLKLRGASAAPFRPIALPIR